MTREGQDRQALAILLGAALLARLPVLLGTPGFTMAGGLFLGPLFKAPSLAGDLGVVWMIYRLLRQMNPPLPGAPMVRFGFLNQRAFWPALAYAASPLAVVISAGYGSLDSLAIFFLLLAVHFFEFSSHPLSERWAALSLGAAAGGAWWPLFLAPLFLKNLLRSRERLVFCLWMLPPLALGGLLFFLWRPADFPGAFANWAGPGALSLPGAINSLGAALSPATEAFARLSRAYESLAGIFLAGLFLVYSLGPWQFPLMPGLSLGVLTLYAFAPSFPARQLLWLAPVSLLAGRALNQRHAWLGLALVLLYSLAFCPEAVFNAAFRGTGRVHPAFLAVWACLNLGAWIYWLWKWRGLLRYCLRPPGILSR